jgi:hypothetical protein
MVELMPAADRARRVLGRVGDPVRVVTAAMPSSSTGPPGRKRAAGRRTRRGPDPPARRRPRTPRLSRSRSRRRGAASLDPDDDASGRSRDCGEPAGPKARWPCPATPRPMCPCRTPWPMCRARRHGRCARARPMTDVPVPDAVADVPVPDAVPDAHVPDAAMPECSGGIPRPGPRARTGLARPRNRSTRVRRARLRRSAGRCRESRRAAAGGGAV